MEFEIEERDWFLVEERVLGDPWPELPLTVLGKSVPMICARLARGRSRVCSDPKDHLQSGPSGRSRVLPGKHGWPLRPAASRMKSTRREVDAALASAVRARR